MSAKAWSGTWHRAENSDYDARLDGEHDGPIDFTEGSYEFTVVHDSGRQWQYTVEAIRKDTPQADVVQAALVNNDETFISDGVMKSITKAMTLATFQIIEWYGYAK